LNYFQKNHSSIPLITPHQINNNLSKYYQYTDEDYLRPIFQNNVNNSNIIHDHNYQNEKNDSNLLIPLISPLNYYNNRNLLAHLQLSTKNSMNINLDNLLPPSELESCVYNGNYYNYLYPNYISPSNNNINFYNNLNNISNNSNSNYNKEINIQNKILINETAKSEVELEKKFSFGLDNNSNSNLNYHTSNYNSNQDKNNEVNGVNTKENKPNKKNNLSKLKKIPSIDLDLIKASDTQKIFSDSFMETFQIYPNVNECSSKLCPVYFNDNNENQNNISYLLNTGKKSTSSLIFNVSPKSAFFSTRKNNC